MIFFAKFAKSSKPLNWKRKPSTSYLNLAMEYLRKIGINTSKSKIKSKLQLSSHIGRICSLTPTKVNSIKVQHIRVDIGHIWTEKLVNSRDYVANLQKVAHWDLVFNQIKYKLETQKKFGSQEGTQPKVYPFFLFKSMFLIQLVIIWLGPYHVPPLCSYD